MGSGGAYSVVASVVRPSSTFSKDVFSEITMQPPDKGGKVVFIVPDHMTKIAVMPIYMVKIFETSSPDPLGRLP